MPYYPKLKFRSSDSAKIRAKKQRVIDRIRILRQALNQHFASSRDNTQQFGTAKIATWNLREFGKKNYGGRSFEELYYIAEIIAQFDLVALQEIRSDLTEFRELKRILGPQWDFIATDVTDGKAGNDERMVFLFDRNKVQFRNIAGELTLRESQKVQASFGERVNLENGIVLDLHSQDLSGIYKASTATKKGDIVLNEDLEIPIQGSCHLILPEGCYLAVKKGTVISRPKRGHAEIQLQSGPIQGENFAIRFPEGSFDDSLKQFARTPFLLSFQLGWLKLNLCTVHIYYGSSSNEQKLKQREQEIALLTQALADKAKREFADDKESFMGVLGDFNIIGRDHSTMQALEANGFEIPEKLKKIPGSNVAKDKAYDQIAFWMPSTRSTDYSKIEVVGANVFDFFEYVFTQGDEDIYREEGVSFNGLKPKGNYKQWRTYKMSDHLPMWVEVSNDFSESYLKYIEASAPE